MNMSILDIDDYCTSNYVDSRAETSIPCQAKESTISVLSKSLEEYRLSELYVYRLIEDWWGRLISLEEAATMYIV